MVKIITNGTAVFGNSIKEHNERQPNRKVRFIVIDVPWKIFSQTGNIEAYLWMKQMELEEPEDIVNQQDAYSYTEDKSQL
jgi:hypothetical protein